MAADQPPLLFLRTPTKKFLLAGTASHHPAQLRAYNPQPGADDIPQDRQQQPDGGQARMIDLGHQRRRGDPADVGLACGRDQGQRQQENESMKRYNRLCFYNC